MNILKRWIGISFLEERVDELYTEINELKELRENDRDYICKISRFLMKEDMKQVSLSSLEPPGKKPKVKPKKKERKDGLDEKTC